MSENDQKAGQKGADLGALVARIQAGELTKMGAADELGWSYPRLCNALRRAGLLDLVRTPRTTAKYDTAAMESAVAEALSTLEKTPLTEIARKHGVPDAQYAAFAMRVLHRKRSRVKADLTDVQVQDSGAAAGG